MITQTMGIKVRREPLSSLDCFAQHLGMLEFQVERFKPLGTEWIQLVKLEINAIYYLDSDKILQFRWMC